MKQDERRLAIKTQRQQLIQELEAIYLAAGGRCHAGAPQVTR